MRAMESMERAEPLARHGVIIGKFLPPHLGHFHLVASAARRARRLTVLVCTLRSECIPGRLRYAWMREMCEALGPHVHVVHSTSEVPQEPHEHPDFYAIWRDKIFLGAGAASAAHGGQAGLSGPRTADTALHAPYAAAGEPSQSPPLRSDEPVPPIDALFSSEEYGWPLSRALGCEHRPVDVGRIGVPVSATKIRTQPAKHWAFVPVPVRPWLVKRVLLYGPESTGKTTAAQLLARHYGTVWAPEWARLLLETRDPQVVRIDDIPVIAREHLKLEDALAREATAGVMFVDSDPITTSIYARHYFDGHCPPHIPLLGDLRHYHARLLFTPEVPWIQDGQRDSPEGRDRLYVKFREELDRRGLAYTLISGPDYEDRIRQCVAAVDAVLRQPWTPPPPDAFITADEAMMRCAGEG
ncbi:transcriptional regulator [Verrucomicrobia bacterium LW23]|nr:transcriptional regulator [Verrucomicrobia bacterium LW23]